MLGAHCKKILVGTHYEATGTKTLNTNNEVSNTKIFMVNDSIKIQARGQVSSNTWKL